MWFRKTLLAIAVAIAAAGLLGPGAQAETPQSLKWDDLVPPAPPLQMPFQNLSMEQRDDVSFILRTRADVDQGFALPNGPEAQEAEQAAKALRAEGVDLEAMLAEAERVRQEVERRNNAVVEALDGRSVRMPGYALPLEFEDEGSRELLLVPFVGACIHVPPPPPNQMVLVRLEKPYVVDNLYAPVWVTGTLHVEGTSRSLSYVDGSAMLQTSYAIDGISVQPYQE